MIRLSLVFAFSLTAATLGPSNYFMPIHRLSGIGVSRQEISPDVLAERVKLMQDAQTFFFMREPQAVSGAERIESPKLARIFEDASRRSGWPVSLIKSIAYLESFGDPNAVSPAGCKGIMQISGPTAIDMGLRMIYSTKYTFTTERRAITVKGRKGKTSVVYRNVKRRVPHQVLLRDERLVPEIAIPAAANYLARIEKSFGGQDWAVFAYHCGVGCVGHMQSLVQRASGISKPITVPKMFFTASPVLNRDLYDFIKMNMERDWSPTYWFRVMRAQQLLQLYREDRKAFIELANYYRYDPDPAQRAQHRLAVWLKPGDLLFQREGDVLAELGKGLARIPEDPEYFGYRVNHDSIAAQEPDGADHYLTASPAALGTLAYIAFETRRLHEAMRPRGEQYVPLEVTSLVRSMDSLGRGNGSGSGPSEATAHVSGQVFDIRYSSLPPGEREALNFVLEDMGYLGYLGFIDETPNSGTMHIGCSPSSREFFAKVYQDALGARSR